MRLGEDKSYRFGLNI